jgi:hypothetical protein
VRPAALVATALVLAFGIAAVREATENRPDAVVDGSATVVDFDVALHRYQRGEPAAAAALWVVCSATIGGDVSPVPEPVADHWRVQIEPAIGEHGEARLVGCLEDVTIDRVLGDVLTLRTSS